LITYEELEATFFQILKEQNLSWFGKLGANQPNDDSLPILDINAKPYRELLKSSTISIFDFRIYVFACQGYLLGKLGRITEIAKRGQWFVASLTRRLRENEVSFLLIHEGFQLICKGRSCRAFHRIMDIYSLYGYCPTV
jgi:hypothetical protein